MMQLIVHENGTFHQQIALDEISNHLARADNLLWLDITDPTDAEALLLREEFGFHPLAVEDALTSHQRPKVEIYDDHYFLVFYAAHYHPETPDIHINLQALHLFIGSNYLISVHQGPFHHVGDTLARWRSPKSVLTNHLGSLLHALLDAVVDDYFPLMDAVGDRIEDLEDAIFTHFDENAIQAIFALKKDLLMMRRVIAPSRDILNVLLRRELPIFQANDIAYLQDVYDHTVRVTDSIDTYRDLLSNALDSYLSVQSNKLNQIVKVLTITSIMLMTNALVAGIYGMNFQFMPELSWPFGYPFALGLMATLSTGLALLFRRLHWW